MLDCHCHIDRYPDPHAILADASMHGVFIVAITNLPSHFELGRPHLKPYGSVRPALGLHPLAAESHEKEIERFLELLPSCSFVGEVGLDFSREGISTKEIQLMSFRLIVEQLKSSPKVVSIHSRGAESAVLDLLTEYEVEGTVLHWYSGPLNTLEDLARSGHYFSVNPAMTASKRGRSIIDRIPPTQFLTESDGPHAKVSGKPAMPWDVGVVEEYMAATWRCKKEEVREQVWKNFKTLTSRLDGTNRSSVDTSQRSDEIE